MVEGVDVAHSADGDVNWDKVAGSGVKFAFIKATQGTYNTQTNFSASWSSAKSAGILRGAYHFFDPTQDGAAQAAHYLQTLGGDYGELPAALDLECPNGDAKCLGGPGAGNAPGSAITKRVHQFLDAVEATTGRKPIVYTFPAYFGGAGVSVAGLDAYPLWIASLSSTCATTPSPWKKPVFWQYSWTGSVPGINAKVDKDRFLGTLDELIAFSNGQAPAPPPPSTGTSPPPPPPPSGCAPVTFPSGVTLSTKPDAALTAQYTALGSSCTVPKCFLDTEDLTSPDGTKHDVHVKVSDHFALYEIVHTEVDPNGTGNVDPAHAFSTKVLVSPDLVTHLETLRIDEGGPVSLTSGYRSPAHQQSICQSICGANQCTDASGSVTCAKNSRHMWGAAADMSLTYEGAANQAGFPFVFHEAGGTGPHLHVDMQSCK